MNEQILNNLITLYREKGISFEHLLKNEVFLALPVEVRINLIKAHAKELADGIHFDSADVKYLLKTLGAAAMAAVSIYGMHHKTLGIPISDPRLRAIAGASSVGAVYAGIRSIKNLRSDLAQKSRAREFLADPTTTNSVQLLAQLHGLKKLRE